MPKQHKVITLYVNIEGINPPIWRRIAVDGAISLRALHHIIQAAFGWCDSHLHEFTVEERTYRMLDNENVLDMIEEPEDGMYDDRKSKLEHLFYPGQTSIYLYDFGDSWEHRIKVEKIEERPQPMGSGWIIDGKRAGPPEDVGGIPGYEEFLDAVTNQRDEEQAQQYLQWVGDEFDSEAFDKRIANSTLQRMAWNGWGRK